MLSRLVIENYALIEHLEIEFSGGFSVITGETGAGKSILLGAISLLLGQRSDASVLLDKSKKCIVEGTFQTKGYALEEFFIMQQLDLDDTTLIRREINQAGKSRAFINDTPVSLAVMRSLGERLLNIHSQHSVITLHESDFQLAVIDSFSGNTENVGQYAHKFGLYLALKTELEEMILKERRSRSEKDYQSFLFQELQDAGLIKGEQESAEERLRIITHSEEIKTLLQKVTQLLSEGEENILGRLTEVVNTVQGIAKYEENAGILAQRVASCQIDLKDISRELTRMEGDVLFDPAEIAKLSGRLDIIYSLQKKHNVTTVDELILKTKDLAAKLEEVQSLDEKIEALSGKIQALKDELTDDAVKISKVRKSAVPAIEKKLVETLKKLGIPDARIKLDINSENGLLKDGCDTIKFLFSANKGIEMDDISRIASGGELSRVMLSIKSMISGKNLLPTIIFDEIDSGVSGNVAGKVGSILKAMGEKMQVIAITHLPQIAGMGETHFWVYKETLQDTAQTHILKLSREERVKEIAKMLSNKEITSAALKTAEELLVS